MPIHKYPGKSHARLQASTVHRFPLTNLIKLFTAEIQPKVNNYRANLSKVLLLTSIRRKTNPTVCHYPEGFRHLFHRYFQRGNVPIFPL